MTCLHHDALSECLTVKILICSIIDVGLGAGSDALSAYVTMPTQGTFSNHKATTSHSQPVYII